MQLPGVPAESGPCRDLDPGEGGGSLDRAFGGWGQELKDWVGKSKVHGSLAP